MPRTILTFPCEAGEGWDGGNKGKTEVGMGLSTFPGADRELVAPARPSESNQREGRPGEPRLRVPCVTRRVRGLWNSLGHYPAEQVPDQVYAELSAFLKS